MIWTPPTKEQWENFNCNKLAKALDHWSCIFFLDGNEYVFHHGCRANIETSLYLNGGTWNGGNVYDSFEGMDEELQKLFDHRYLLVKRLEKSASDPYYVMNVHYGIVPCSSLEEARRAKRHPKDGILEVVDGQLVEIDPIQSVEDDFAIPVVATQVYYNESSLLPSMYSHPTVGMLDIYAICEGYKDKMMGWSFRYADNKECD